jgi:hypothetical protein
MITEAELDLLVSHLKPVVARARLTISPNVTVNTILVENCYDALTEYRDLLRKAFAMAEEGK